jgi:hypothetical protein
MTKPPRFVSVGGNCQPVVHIRRISGGQEIPYVFDWLECGIEAVSTLIKTEFAEFFSLDALLFHWVDGALEVTDQSNGIIARHNFKSAEREHVEQVVLSLRLMGRRFMQLLRGGEEVIFVRRWISKDGALGDEAARGLHELLQSYKPGCGFLYLQEQAMRAPVVEGNYVSAFNPRTTNVDDWEGYEPLYDSSFARAMRAYESHFAATLPSALQE